MAIPAEIYCDNDLPIEVGPINIRAFATGAISLGTGITVNAMLSATNTVSATPIHADLSIVLTEGVGSTAVFYGGWNGDKLTSRLLPTYKDAVVYVIVWSGQDFRVVGSVTVRDVRPLDEA